VIRGELIYAYDDERYCVHLVRDHNVTDWVVTPEEAVAHAVAWNDIVRQIVEHMTTGKVTAS
jgi:hypothetical protein